MTTHLIGARAVIAAAHEVDVPVVAGGKAFGPAGAWASAAGADAYVGSLRDVADIVERWTEEPPTVGPVATLPAKLQELLVNRSSILTTVESTLGEEDRRLSGEAGLLLGAIEVALLTGDDGAIDDMLTWQDAMLRAHGLDSSLVADAVEEALVGRSEEAGAALARARARSVAD
jgi:hypothetical protein